MHQTFTHPDPILPASLPPRPIGALPPSLPPPLSAPPSSSHPSPRFHSAQQRAPSSSQGARRPSPTHLIIPRTRLYAASMQPSLPTSSCHPHPLPNASQPERLSAYKNHNPLPPPLPRSPSGPRAPLRAAAAAAGGGGGGGGGSRGLGLSSRPAAPPPSSLFLPPFHPLCRARARARRRRAFVSGLCRKAHPPPRSSPSRPPTAGPLPLSLSPSPSHPPRSGQQAHRTCTISAPRTRAALHPSPHLSLDRFAHTHPPRQTLRGLLAPSS